jgi:hypothetical protein
MTFAIGGEASPLPSPFQFWKGEGSGVRDGRASAEREGTLRPESYVDGIAGGEAIPHPRPLSLPELEGRGEFV